MTASPQELARLIGSNRYRYQDEAQLHDAIALALEAAGVGAVAEARLSDRDRIDFLAGSTGIEVKVAGSAAEVARQLRRYAEHPVIEALLLVTTRVRHRRMPRQIGGKPVFVVWLSGVAL